MLTLKAIELEVISMPKGRAVPLAYRPAIR